MREIKRGTHTRKVRRTKKRIPIEEILEKVRRMYLTKEELAGK